MKNLIECFYHVLKAGLQHVDFSASGEFSVCADFQLIRIAIPMIRRTASKYNTEISR